MDASGDLFSGAYGDTLASVFGVPSPPTVINRSLAAGLLAATEVRDDAPEHGISKPIPIENAYLATLHLRTIVGHVAWEDGRQYPVETLAVGDLLIRDLRRNPTVLVNQPHHEIHFYIPATALDTIADDCGARRIDDLNYAPGRAIKDSVMANLSKAMLGALESGEEPCRLFVDHLLSAVATHLAISAGGLEPRSRPAIGCLSAAQERRAKEVLSANLGGDLELADLARECGLSMGYFGRAFRRSTGMAPHQWLVRRRVQIAKRHLGETALPLAEVALESGFVDQSHFTRVFTQHVGTSPGRWRAARRADASEEGV